MPNSPSYNGSLLGAIDWISGTMVGPVATSLAILAVAMIGILLLAGRLAMRQGVLVVVGCSVLFSASTIAQGIVTHTAPPALVFDHTVVDDAPPAQPSRPPPKPYDPYAGAAVPLQTEQPVIR